MNEASAYQAASFSRFSLVYTFVVLVATDTVLAVVLE
jgi:hypothetical protein